MVGLGTYGQRRSTTHTWNNLENPPASCGLGLCKLCLFQSFPFDLSNLVEPWAVSGSRWWFDFRRRSRFGRLAERCLRCWWSRHLGQSVAQCTQSALHSWAPSERHLSTWCSSACATPVPLLCFPLWDLVGQGEAPSRKAHNPNVSAHVSIATFLRGVRLNENVSKPLPYIFLHSFFKILTGPSVFTCLLLRCAYGTCWCSGFLPSLEEEAAEPGEQWYFVGLLVAIVCPIGEHWQLSQVTHSRRLRGESWAPLGTANAKGCSLRSCTLNSCLKQLLLRVQNWCRKLASGLERNSSTHVAAAPDHPSASLGPG